MDIKASGSNGKERITEVLEVEDEEQRHERMHELLSRINVSAKSVLLEAPPAFDFRDKSTFPVAPPLELLSRVQAFLPELAASNADLLRRAKEDPESVDIENVGEDQLQYIEMNLGLGVFESRGQAPSNIPVADVDVDFGLGDVEMDGAPNTNSSPGTDSDSSSSDSDSSDDSDSDDSDPGLNVLPARSTARPIRPLPARAARQGQQQQQRIAPATARPEIVVLSESNDADRSPDP